MKRLKKERSRLRLCYDDRENCVGNDIVESVSRNDTIFLYIPACL